LIQQILFITMGIKSLITESNSWFSFKSKIDLLSKKEKGDAFEQLTKIYFKINPIYKFYDEVWLLNEVPTSVLEYLEIPSHDLGIDLIAKQGNEYHAIQCKYHSDKTSSITFKEVSTFISLLESNEKFTQGYICSSADLTSRNFNKLKTKPINLIMSDSWQVLDNEFFLQAHEILEGKKTNLVPYEPRQHQVKALKQSIEYFQKEDNSRGKLIFPCGAGKSLTGFWMTQELKSKSTIIAVPSLSLVKQTLEVYLREIVAKNRRIKWLCICSDEGIGANDDVVIFTENIGVPCQTDPSYIEQWLKDNIDEEKIIFTTYQSGRIIAEISKKLNFTFDVGIFDEAHKTVGSDKKLFSHLLFEENISISKRIFMTATERFYAGSKDDIISMDDEDIYGDTFAQMSFKKAIEIGLLTDYKVITIDIKKSEIAEFIRDNNLVQLNDKWKKETEARSLASMLALRKAMKQFNIKNAVSFHSSIEKAVRNKELQHYITETYDYEPIDTYTVSGKQSTSKRNDIVQEFASSSKALITNARCLTEGVDVPNIDCIVFADPRKSRVDIVQALGRALRKKEGKDWGYVILPVIYDDETREIDNDNFNEILSVVRGLASNDERIVEYFKDKNQKEGIKKNETSEQFNFEVFSDYIDESQLSEQLQIRLWDKLAKYNWMTFEEARRIISKLELQSLSDWQSYINSNSAIKNIPKAPWSFYRNNGWVSMGDWLGTGRVASQLKEYRSFEEAREFARSLSLKNGSEWLLYCRSGKKPDDIPTFPRQTYKDMGWKGTGDWLGIKNHLDTEFYDFDKAKDIIAELGIKSMNEWRVYYKKHKPKGLPSAPNRTYENSGWKGFGDYFGTGVVANYNKKYREFEKAREFARSLKLKTVSEWRAYCKSGQNPDDISGSPHNTYRNEGWIGYGDWLGSGTVADGTQEWGSIDQAKIFVKKHNIKSKGEWAEFKKENKLPKNIPLNPYGVYIRTNEWISWTDFFGRDKPYKPPSSPRGTYMSFEEAKKWVKEKGILTSREYKDYKRPNSLPFSPNNILQWRDEWKGWADFLGKKLEN
jgi:superfamily II DNA or RNA helicase